MKLSFWRKPKTGRIHLDYASTTPVHDEVLRAMRPYFSEEWANANAIYKEGAHARTVIEKARTELARTLRVRPADITFTSGGTESNNLAICGLVEFLQESGKRYDEMEILSTRIEHPSITETLHHLEKRGVKVVYVPIDSEGVIQVEGLQSLLSTQTILVTFAYVNSEIGVVQPVKKITRIIHAWNESCGAEVRTHIDASQAPLWLPCEIDSLGADLMTLDAGKCYGPKGVGVLVHRHWVKLSPIIFGGGQEDGLRSGTENTALIIGCVRAVVRAQKDHVSRSVATATLRDTLFTMIQEKIPEAIINGSREVRVANNVNVSIPGVDTEYATIWLDEKGIAVSTKSACGATASTGSSVVREVTGDNERARSTLRLTLGEETSEEDLVKTVSILKEYLSCMRAHALK